MAVTDSAGGRDSQTFNLVVLDQGDPLEIVSDQIRGPTRGLAYAATLDARGGSEAGYQWDIVGLPMGLSVQSGTPTATLTGTVQTEEAGQFALTVTVTDSANNTTSRNITLTVRDPQTLVISQTNLPSGRLSQMYDGSLRSVGGAPPYTWTVTGGQLPAGLMLADTTSATLRVTGTPTAAGASC
ncbi:MAG: hypothetical protein HC923_12410 [Myxococcales bacterium]|nr:hypothetical protein [Myxococcales bacterium]